MLVRGQAKLKDRGVAARTGLLSGDAERLPFRDGSFDGTVVGFGIRNVGDIDAALGEVARVLRPGGRFTILEFSMPRGVFGTLYRAYFGRVLPLVGRLLSGDDGAYRYLPASVGKFDSPEALQARLERAGFRDVVREPLTFGIAWLHSGTRA
jgi:demethylmenaquinone methyltransferase/2-methoxy-6-polyprenyl-1,4-benzoquinol methylase